MKDFATPISIIIGSIFIASSIIVHGFIKPIDFSNIKGLQTQNNEPTAQLAPKVNVSIDNDPMQGDPNAKVTIIEFSDFQCPFCERFFTDTLARIKQEYIDTGKAKIVYRDYPLPFHPNAYVSAEAAECANAQGKFWEMHDTLFSKQTEWAELSNQDAKVKFGTYAANLGLDVNAFNTCVNTETYKDEIQKDTADGSKAGVTGTPTLFINGKMIVGAQPYETFKEAIDAELK